MAMMMSRSFTLGCVVPQLPTRITRLTPYSVINSVQ